MMGRTIEVMHDERPPSPDLPAIDRIATDGATDVPIVWHGNLLFGPDREAPTCDLKCVPPHFNHVWHGRKRAEVRQVDPEKRIAVGDLVLLHEWVPAPAPGSTTQYDPHYTGRTCVVRVTHLLTDDDVPNLLPVLTHVWSFEVLARYQAAVRS